MSSFAYGVLTRTRKKNDPNTTETTSPPGVKSFIDALAALVPAEILILHALIIERTTKTTPPTMGGQPVVTITEPGTLRYAFWGLLLLSVVFYALGRRNSWDKWDGIRVFIPALAFVGWTMLQKATAFDAVAPTLRQVPREVIALFAASALGVAATALSYKADQSKPPEPKPEPEATVESPAPVRPKQVR